MHQQTNKPAKDGVSALLPADWDKTVDVLVIVGEGAGPISEAFVSHGLGRVFVMLPPPLAPERVPIGAISVTSRGALSREIGTLTGGEPKRFALVRTPNCSLSNDETQAIHHLTTDLLKRRRAAKHIHAQLAPLWAANGLDNLPKIGRMPMVTDIEDAFMGVPMIIVGAGPSLAKNIGQLKAAQGKAIIVATARTLRGLQDAGVWPDFAISLDATEVRCQFQDIALHRIPGVMISATSHPDLLTLADTCLLSFSSNTEAEGWMFDAVDGVTEMPTGGSVSCSAMSIGLHWGCSPIILVGQDLSFPGGQFYHADGADGDTSAIFNADNNTWTLEGYSTELAHTLRHSITDKGLRFSGTEVPGYFGGTVPTNPTFSAVRTWFGFTAYDHKNTTTMLNCTEGGAHIDGMAHIPLAKAMADLAPRQVDVTVVLRQLTHSPALKSRTKRFEHKAKTTRAAITEATALAHRCVQLIDQALRHPSAIAGLSPLEAKLSKAMKQAFVLNLLAQEDIQKAIAEGHQATSLKDSLGASRKLYQIILDQSSRLIRPTQ